MLFFPQNHLLDLGPYHFHANRSNPQHEIYCIPLETISLVHINSFNGHTYFCSSRRTAKLNLYHFRTWEDVDLPKVLKKRARPGACAEKSVDLLEVVKKTARTAEISATNDCLLPLLPPAFRRIPEVYVLTGVCPGGRGTPEQHLTPPPPLKGRMWHAYVHAGGRSCWFFFFLSSNTRVRLIKNVYVSDYKTKLRPG